MSKTMAPSASKSSQTKSNTSSLQTAPATQRKNSQMAPHAAPIGQSPGLMTQIMANAASTAGGVVAAHAIMNALGMKGHPVENGQMTPEATQAFQTAASGPCSVQFEAFSKCAENAQDVGNCQWAVDMFKDCQTKANGGAPPKQMEVQSSNQLPNYKSSDYQNEERNW